MSFVYVENTDPAAGEIVGVVNIQSLLDFFQQQFQKYCLLFPFQFADLQVLNIMIISRKWTFQIKQHFLFHKTQRDAVSLLQIFGASHRFHSHS